jgi:hypothetical protein
MQKKSSTKQEDTKKKKKKRTWYEEAKYYDILIVICLAKKKSNRQWIAWNHLRLQKIKKCEKEERMMQKNLKGKRTKIWLVFYEHLYIYIFEGLALQQPKKKVKWEKMNWDHKTFYDSVINYFVFSYK